MKRGLKNIREDYPYTIILIRIGNFYKAYDEDSYIIAYLMNYKIKTNIISEMTGFPITSLNKVVEKLEMKKINYKIFETKENKPFIKQESDFQENNQYKNILELAEKYIMKKNKIDKLLEYLNDNIENNEVDNILKQIEQIIYK